MNLRALCSLLSLLVLGLPLRGAETTAAESPLKPLEFWIGGVWRGQLPPAPNGRTVALETTFTWMENKQAIRFDTIAVNGERRTGYSSGLYGWHPAKKAIVFWYFDNAGTLYEGTVKLDAGVLVHNFTSTKRDEKTATYRARITREGDNAYENAIFQPQGDQWTQMVAVRYERK